MSKYNLRLICILAFLAMLNCDFNDGTGVDAKQVSHVPKFNFEYIDIPEGLKQSPDTMAQKAVHFLEFNNNMEEHTKLLQLVPDTVSLDFPYSKEWYDYQGMKLELSITEGDKVYLTDYHWKLLKSGTNNITGLTYDKWLYVDAIMDSTGDFMELKVYDYNSTRFKIYYRSYISNSRILHTLFRVNIVGEETLFEFELYGKYYADVYETAEGMVRFNDDLDIRYEIYWNKDGSGYWYKKVCIFLDVFEIIEEGNWDS